MGVIRKRQETPLHPPYGRGDKGLRQANKKPRVEYWHKLLAYIDSAYVKKFGQHYPWNNLARKNLWNMARVHSAWGVMALWDLYLAGESWWARQTNYSTYGMLREASRLMDDARFKPLVGEHEENLAKERFGGRINTREVFNSLFTPFACELSRPENRRAFGMPRDTGDIRIEDGKRRPRHVDPL